MTDLDLASFRDRDSHRGRVLARGGQPFSTTAVRAHREARTDWSLAMRHTANGWVDPDATSTTLRNDGELYTGIDNHGRIARVRWDATDSLGFYTSERDDFAYGHDANGNRLYDGDDETAG